MRLLRTIAVTFARYSRIPMPRFNWEDEDMKYSLAVFPWVGAVIGLVYVLMFRGGRAAGMPDIAVCFLMTATPLVITGGFHLDGFMDVSDARSSYGSREKKLEILKDPHIGAFAVIRLCILGLIYIACLVTMLGSEDADALVTVTAAGFFMARGFSALSVLTFKSAKKEGMLYYEASSAGAGRKANIVMTVIWLVLASAFMIYTSPVAGVLETAAAIVCFFIYKQMSYREFGGITGDTAGWFVCVCETAMVVVTLFYR